MLLTPFRTKNDQPKSNTLRTTISMMVPISAVACSTDGSMPYSRWLRSRRRVNSALHHIRRQLVESRGPPPIRGCHEVPALRHSVPRARAGPDPAAWGPNRCRAASGFSWCPPGRGHSPPYRKGSPCLTSGPAPLRPARTCLRGSGECSRERTPARYQNKVAAAQVGRPCISIAITSLSSTSVRRVARSQPRLPAGSAPTSSRAGPMRRLLSETVNLLRRGRAGEVIAGDFHMRASWKAGQESSMRSGITAQGRSS
jgi:hypothetical protein